MAEKQFLAEVEHPLIVEIYNFVAARRRRVVHRDGVRRRAVAEQPAEEPDEGEQRPVLADPARPGDRLHDRGAAGVLVPARRSGLLYCDFKPANLIQVGDGIKLIDLGGVRRVDDDVSPIYGTVGFQAPEVPADGTSVASDIYTVARTLAVLMFEFKGYQNQYVDSLPTPDEVPLFAEHDSLYRLLLRATARRPGGPVPDRPRRCALQLLGVLREVTAQADAAAPSRAARRRRCSSTPAVVDRPARVERPAAAAARPRRPDGRVAGRRHRRRSGAAARAARPGARAVAGVCDRRRAYAALELGRPAERRRDRAARCSHADPWDWRGVWLQGLAALQAGRATRRGRRVQHGLRAAARRARPEAGARPWRASSPATSTSPSGCTRVCARTDAAYVAPAQFGLARVAAAGGRRDGRRSPRSTGSRRRAAPTAMSRRKRAADPRGRRPDGGAAARRPRRGGRASSTQAAIDRRRAQPRCASRSSSAALARVVDRRADAPAAAVGGVAGRRAVAAPRARAARTARPPRPRPTAPTRIRLVDRANQVRTADAGLTATVDDLPDAAARRSADADAFCEACGGDADRHDRRGAAGGEPRATAAAATLARRPRPIRRAAATAQPARPRRSRRTRSARRAGGRASPCGGEVARRRLLRARAGRRRASARDHWTETPGDVGRRACATRASRTRATRTRWRSAGDADGSRSRVLVVCDGVTTAPDSDRASLAAARAACRAARRRRPPRRTGRRRRRGCAHWRAAARRRLPATANARGRRRRRARSATRPSRRRARSSPPCVDATTCVAVGVVRRLAAPTGCPTAAQGAQLGVDHSLGTEMIAPGVDRRGGRGAIPTFHTITRWLGADSIDPTPRVRRAASSTSPGWVLVCSATGCGTTPRPPATLAELLARARSATVRPRRRRSPSRSLRGRTSAAATTTSRWPSPAASHGVP